MKTVDGYYSTTGYRIEVDGVEVYSAGNHPNDSQVWVPADEGVSLDTLREYCESTMEEIVAEEHGARIGSVFFEDDEDDED